MKVIIEKPDVFTPTTTITTWGARERGKWSTWSSHSGELEIDWWFWPADYCELFASFANTLHVIGIVSWLLFNFSWRITGCICSPQVRIRGTLWALFSNGQNKSVAYDMLAVVWQWGLCDIHNHYINVYVKSFPSVHIYGCSLHEKYVCNPECFVFPLLAPTEWMRGVALVWSVKGRTVRRLTQAIHRH